MVGSAEGALPAHRRARDGARLAGAAGRDRDLAGAGAPTGAAALAAPGRAGRRGRRADRDGRVGRRGPTARDLLAVTSRGCRERQLGASRRSAVVLAIAGPLRRSTSLSAKAMVVPGPRLVTTLPSSTTCS